jgi:hypothetical protein
MNKFTSFGFLALMAFPAYASVSKHEFQTINVDFAGNGKPQKAIIQLEPENNSPKIKVMLSVGKSKYKSLDMFTTYDSEVPVVSILPLGEHTPKQLLVLSIPQPTSCEIRIFGYERQEVRQLFEAKSKLCETPISNFDGTFKFSVRKGFWSKEEKFQITPAGTSFEKVSQHQYNLNATGAAKNDSTLEAGEGDKSCKTRALKKGEFVRISEYDEAQKRYFVKTFSGACGWLYEEKLNENLSELPYAD